MLNRDNHSIHLDKSRNQENVRYTPANDDIKLDTFAGVYTDPGYGTFELCSPKSISPQCVRTLQDFAAVPNAVPSPDEDALFATWPRVWVSYLRLRRTGNATFSFIGAELFPKGYGRDKSPFAFYEEVDDARVEFVLDNSGSVVGFGIFGLVGEVTERERTGATVQDRAEVWFSSV